jgi:hypothetical protein
VNLTNVTREMNEWDDDEDGTFEVVDELLFDEIVDEGFPSVAPPAPGDGFTRLVALLEEVARRAAGDGAAFAVQGVLLASPEARGWQRVLCGECDDLSECGALALDEWCAGIVARAVGNVSRADGLRRELRRRGVAAFGWLEDAA